MKKRKLLGALVAVTLGGVGVLAGGPAPAGASSHREAPLISQDATADNTDLYMFRDANDPSKVNIIANYIGLEPPASGPNFVRFGDDVQYEIHIDNNGDVQDDITFQFRFRTTVANPNTFLYNTFTIDPNDLRQPERQADVLGADDQERSGHDAGHERAHAAGEHRPALHAELLAVHGRVDQVAAGWRQGVRRAAQRPVLRRPRLGVRPARPPADQQRPPRAAARTRTA